MGRITRFLKSLVTRKDAEKKAEKKAIDRWENEGGPPAEDPEDRPESNRRS